MNRVRILTAMSTYGATGVAWCADIYFGGKLHTSAKAALEDGAVREAVAKFRLARADRRSEVKPRAQ